MKNSLVFFNDSLTATSVATGLAHSVAVQEHRAALRAYLSNSTREEKSITAALNVFIAPVLVAIDALPIDEQDKAKNALDRAFKRALEGAGYPELGFFTMRTKKGYVICHIDGKKPQAAQAAAYAGALAKAKEMQAKAVKPAPVKTGKGAPVRPDSILPEAPVGYTDLLSAIGLLEKLLVKPTLTKAEKTALAGLGLTITALLAPKVPAISNNTSIAA